MQKHYKTRAKRGGVGGEARLKRASGSAFAAKTLEFSTETPVGQRMQKKHCKTRGKRTGELLEARPKRKTLDFSTKIMLVHPRASSSWATHGKDTGIAD